MFDPRSNAFPLVIAAIFDQLPTDKLNFEHENKDREIDIDSLDELNICELIDHNSDIQVDCGGTDVSKYEKEPEYFGSHDIVGIDDDFWTT